MPRYHFHVVNGIGETRDDEGMELPDLDAARREALAGIRSILREEILGGSIDFAGEIRITDDQDQHLLEVPFRAAVKVRNLKGAG
jgi:hypothetical protein